MNFENQTAENRNQINDINNIQRRHIMNPLHYIRTRHMNPLRIIINSNRHCSFCNANGHNIRSCDDTRLTDFENECLISKNICDLTNNSRVSFKQWLLYYYMNNNINNNLIKAFAVRKCNCLINSSPNIFIEKIINYIYQEREEIQEFIPFTEIVSALLLLSEDENMAIARNKFTIHKSIEKLDEIKSEELCECAICYEDGLQNKNFITLNCEHKFCKDCFKGSLSHTPLSQPIPTCALCRTEILSIIIHEESVKDELNDLIQ